MEILTDETIKTTYRINAKHHKALKILAIEEEKPVRALIDEFIKDGLIKYGVKLDE